MLGLSILTSGCNGPLPPHAKKNLQKAEDHYLAKRYVSAVDETSKVIRDFPKCDGIEQAYYLRGKSWLELNDSFAAKNNFLFAVDVANNPVVKVNSLLALGDIAWQDGDLGSASNMYFQAGELCSRGKSPSDHSNFMLGRVLQRQGNWTQADKCFYYVTEYFPDSELARRCARRVAARSWAVQAEIFKDKKHADSLAEKLGRAGMKADRKMFLEGDSPVFVVFVGRYATYSQAVGELEKVRKICPRASVAVR